MDAEGPFDIRARIESALAERGGSSPKEISQRATMVISVLRGSLARGLVHRNRAGRMLTTELEVLLCMREEGMVTLQRPLTQVEGSGRSPAE